MMMEEPAHTLDADGIKCYREIYKDRHPIEIGDVVRVNTDTALRVMMSGYDDFLEKNDVEKENMTERTLCVGRKMTNLPQFWYCCSRYSRRY